MSTETITLILNQGPYFALLVAVGYGFYKFLDRTYTDHKEQMSALQITFRESLTQITNSLDGQFNGVNDRLDKIEITLEKSKSTRKSI